MDFHDILPINTEFSESGGRRREAEGGGGISHDYQRLANDLFYNHV
jgi:hypothetical protein